MSVKRVHVCKSALTALTHTAVKLLVALAIMLASEALSNPAWAGILFHSSSLVRTLCFGSPGVVRSPDGAYVCAQLGEAVL